MKIFASCVVKNEADVIEECLRAASRWADRIFVYDGSSTDGTWEKVMAMQSDKIVPWKRHDEPFHDWLRARPFQAQRHECSEGDWWCRLDADEFYVNDPRQFLSAVPRWQHVVWGVAIEYYITRDDLKRIDFSAPMAEVLPQLRHYQAENSEQRFFRYRPGLVWRETDAWPVHMGIPARERILYRHYKYRSPEQIQRRLDTRRQSMNRGGAVWTQWQSKLWESEMSDGVGLNVDTGDGTYRIREDRLPRHLDTVPRAALKRVMHGLGIWA